MSYLIIPCFRIKPYDCLEHSIFLKVNTHFINSQKTNSNYSQVKKRLNKFFCRSLRSHKTNSHKNQTTSFLTATMLAYTTGAGITAAAGTRLALQ